MLGQHVFDDAEAVVIHALYGGIELVYGELIAVAQIGSFDVGVIHYRSF